MYLRFWMHREAYQAVTAAINLTAMNIVTHVLTRPNMAWNFVAMADPAFWLPHFSGLNWPRAAEADFAGGGLTYGVYAGLNPMRRAGLFLGSMGTRNEKAGEALDLYTSLFPQSQRHSPVLYEEGEGQPVGYLKFGHFTLAGNLFAAMDGPGEHAFAFNEAVSFVAECSNQEEIDKYWNTLTANGGKESRCGWLVDPYGVSWQIIPNNIGSLMMDPAKSSRVMEAVMKMNKIDMATLENA